MWVVSLVGMGMSAYSSIQQGKAAAAAGEAQKAAYEGEAQAVIMGGAEEAALKRKEGRALAAANIALVSASGGGMVGSNLVVMAESAKNVEMDALTIERNAQTRAKSLRGTGAFAKYEGQLARRNARMRMVSEGFKGASRLYGMYKGYGSFGTGMTSTGAGTTAKRSAKRAGSSGGALLQRGRHNCKFEFEMEIIWE